MKAKDGPTRRHYCYTLFVYCWTDEQLSYNKLLLFRLFGFILYFETLDVRILEFQTRIGHLEMHHNGEHSVVCWDSDNATQRIANVACNNLGFGFVLITVWSVSVKFINEI